MYKYIFFIIVLFTFLFSGYSVGDTISEDDQAFPLTYCYPTDSTNTFSLSKYLGKVFVLDFSAGW